MSSVTHNPVLLHESVSSLALNPTDTVVDGTFGGGGHSAAISELITKGMLICVDLDEAAQQRFAEKFGSDKHVVFVAANFKDADAILASAHVSHADKVLLDLGTSTFQLLDDTRGFSFHSDTPLSMTFAAAGSHTGFTASDIVNSWDESSIADIIYGYGEERSARKIAHAIISARELKRIATAKQLADIIEAAVPRRGRIHPATKTFQALRIATNDELGTLTAAMEAWWQHLSSHGRLSIITFHSLEDRIVKQWMKAQSNGTLITKKPIAPSREELSTNPRSRSAKLRTIEKI
ncbi:MAG: mraW [Candidatus Nomurabacteria bacterium]|jgi:16S rRNA (cytosine1402-N4)-methyltransferase|nr:mraW [Candidatus Nomurabacteria bacterium]